MKTLLVIIVVGLGQSSFPATTPIGVYATKEDCQQAAQMLPADISIPQWRDSLVKGICLPAPNGG
jgi:hypothetical protein